jgi:hypothetical protein
MLRFVGSPDTSVGAMAARSGDGEVVEVDVEFVGGEDLGGEGFEVAAGNVDGCAAVLADDRDGRCAGTLVGGGAVAEVRVFDDAGPFESVDGAVEGRRIEDREESEELVDGDAGVVVEEVLDEITSRPGCAATLCSQSGERLDLVVRWFCGVEAGSRHRAPSL